MRHRIVKFLRLSKREKHTFLQAVFFLLYYRISLKRRPFQKLIRSVYRQSQQELTVAKKHSLEPTRIAWLVAVAHRLVPFSTCLTQAMTGKILLARNNFDAMLHIGVCNDKQAGFKAHAWLSYNGQVLLGETPDLDQFQEFSSFSCEEHL